MRLTWKGAEVAALDRHGWHRSVAQCVQMDARWTKINGTENLLAYLLTNLRRTGGHEPWLAEVEAVVVCYVGMAVEWPVRQKVVNAVLLPATVVGLVCEETLAYLLLQLTQVTPTAIILATRQNNKINWSIKAHLHQQAVVLYICYHQHTIFLTICACSYLI